MRLRPGDTAPDFETVDIEGEPVHLRGRRDGELLLCFYRYAGCPLCNLDLQEVIAFHKKMAPRGLRTIAFFQSPPESVRRYPGRLRPPFPLVGDASKRIYDLYGVESSLLGSARSLAEVGRLRQSHAAGFRQGAIDGDLFLLPAQFLIAPPGNMIALAHYGRTFADRIPFLEIERYFDAKP